MTATQSYDDHDGLARHRVILQGLVSDWSIYATLRRLLEHEIAVSLSTSSHRSSNRCIHIVKNELVPISERHLYSSVTVFQKFVHQREVEE